MKKKLKMSAWTIVSALCFLVALIMVIPAILEFLFLKTETSVYTTQYVVLAYCGVILVFVGILVPFTRQAWIFLEISKTGPLDAVATIVICLISAIPIFVICIVTIPLLRRNWMHLYKYHLYHFSVSVSLFCIGVLVRHKGAIPDLHKAYIQIMNHTSPLDYALASLVAGVNPWNIVAGINLAPRRQKNPKIGDRIIAWSLGKIVEEHSVSIDRSDPESRAKVSQRIYSELKEGKNILIFPEGTRTTYTKIVQDKILLQDFHDGIFRIAFSSKTPISPVVFDWPVIWRGKADTRFGFHPTRIDVHYCDLVYPEHFASWEDLRDYCWAVMNAKLTNSEKIQRFLQDF